MTAEDRAVLTAEQHAAFDRYLTEVLVTAPDPALDSALDSAPGSDLGSALAGGLVRLPECPRWIQPHDLERALDDPRTLFPAFPPAVLDDPAEQFRRLCGFTLWLRYSPPGYLPGHLASRAARLRFAVWSLLPRLGWPPWSRPPLKVAWSMTAEDVRPDDYVPLTPERVLAEARAARDDWLAQLNAWEDDPWLAARHHRDPDALESDLRWLTTTWPGSRPSRLDLEPEPEPDCHPRRGKVPSEGEGAYHRVASDVAELHWLPRGALRPAIAALLPGRRGVRLLPWLFPLAVVAVAGLFAAGLVLVAAGAALILLVAGVAVAGAVPSRLTSLGLLRMPAAAAIGLVVLMSLTPRWWLSPWGWAVGAVLLLICALYIILELRLHGAGWSAYPRGLVLAGIGAGYAFILSLLALAFLAPTVAERGECLAGWWSADPWAVLVLPPGCADLGGGQAAAPAAVLLLMTGWSLAVGLAAQILWDDRPVTAPLGRLRRVRGGTQ